MSTWLYLSEENHGSISPGLKLLKAQGYNIIRRDQADEVETLIRTGVVSGVFFEGRSETDLWGASWRVVKEHPLYPVVFMLPKGDPGQSLVQEQEDELRIGLSPRESVRRQRHLLKSVLRAGALHRRCKELEQSEEGMVFQNPLAMFTQLDVNSILDRLLLHFGPLVPAQNLHWITQSEIVRLLGMDEKSFQLELEHQFLLNPMLRSYREKDLLIVHQILAGLPWGLSRLNDGQALIEWRAQGKNHALVRIEGLQSDSSMGYFLLEDFLSDNLDFLSEQMRATMEHVRPVLVLGFRCWEAETRGYLDILTPLYNQQFLPMVINSEINRCKRSGGEFTVLFLDIDYFKLINDTRGHWIGSKVIHELGQLLHESIRSCDFGFRYGGDEFVILLSGTGFESGSLVAERIRRGVEETVFHVDGQEVSITVSIGVATYPRHGMTKEEIIKIADQAMYSGKNKSRNVVYLAG